MANDTYGHDTFNKVLKIMMNEFRSTVCQECIYICNVKMMKYWIGWLQSDERTGDQASHLHLPKERCHPNHRKLHSLYCMRKMPS